MRKEIKLYFENYNAFCNIFKSRKVILMQHKD